LSEHASGAAISRGSCFATSSNAETSDEWHVDRILEQGSPVRPYVLAHDKDGTGPSPEAKLRRLQDKAKKRRD